MPAAADYDYLLKIPFNGIAGTDDEIRTLINRCRELLTLTLDASRCVVGYSDIVFTTTFKSLAVSFPNDILVSDAYEFNDPENQLVVNVGVKLNLASPKQVVMMLAKIVNILGETMTPDLNERGMVAAFCRKNGNEWQTFTQENMFWMDSSLVNFVKTGGYEKNDSFRTMLTCTYGILYNVMRTFYKDDQMTAHDRLLAAFPHFSLTDVLKHTTYIAELVSSNDDIVLLDALRDVVLQKKVCLKYHDEWDKEFSYKTEVFIEPLYRRGSKLLNGGYKMLPWVEGRMEPGNQRLSEMRDALIWYFAQGNAVSIRDFSMRWRVVGARLRLYVFFVPETVITEKNDIIDCCVCVWMDVHERGSHPTDFFIEWFINAINDEYFDSALPEEEITELLIDDRLKRSQLG